MVTLKRRDKERRGRKGEKGDEGKEGISGGSHKVDYLMKKEGGKRDEKE